MSIPAVLHRIVLPPMKPEGRVEENWRGFRANHPTWTLRTWTSSRPEDWPEVGHLLADCRSPAQRADLMRLELLWREGGVYVDTDCESVRALDPLLDDPCGAFIGQEDDNPLLLANSVLGAEPGHPAIRAYLDALLAGFDPTRPPNETTGPDQATRVLGGRDDITQYDRWHFFPEDYADRDLPWSERGTVESYREGGAYVVHRFAKSWAPRTPAWKKPYYRARVLGGRAKAKIRAAGS